MTLLTWAHSITEGFLITWTNRGLLRRAKKQASNIDTEQWTLDEHVITGQVEAFTLILTEPDISALQCNCGALEPCSHKIAFLLSLKTLETTEPMASPDVFKLAPWLIHHVSELEHIFGKTKSQKALTHWHKGASITLHTHTDHALVDCQIGKKNHQVYLPTQVDWNRLVCSCQEAHCLHQVVAIVGLSLQETQFTLPSSMQPKLKTAQKEKLKEVELWVYQLLSYGLKNALPLQLAQGESFVTELNQNDFPNIARLLELVLQMIEGLTRRQLTITSELFLEHIGQLLLSIHAIQAEPMQRPLTQLAGRHKRHYSDLTLHDVMPVSVEYWNSEKGARGYRFYFYDRKTTQWYCISEGRKANMDSGWSPYSAIHSQRCITPKNTTIALLDFALHRMDFNGQVSDNHSLKIERLLSEPERIDWENMINDPALSIKNQWLRLGESYNDLSFDPMINGLGWVITHDEVTIEHQLYQMHQKCTVETPCGQRINIHLNSPQSKNIKNKGTKLLFGRWTPTLSAINFHVLEVFTHSDFDIKAKKHG